MLEKTIVVGPFQCNARIIACPKTGEAVLVDPGDEAQNILRELERAQVPSGAKISVKFLLHTHGHLDHIGATRTVREALSTPKIAIHRGDEPIYRALKMQGQLFHLSYDDPLPIDHYLEHEEELRVGELKFSIIHTPGHSPGSICIRLHENSSAGIREEILYSGDTLFQGSVGRTDLWGADQEQMFKNIHERILTCPDETRVCPGHGPDTTIGIEKRANPFLV